MRTKTILFSLMILGFSPSTFGDEPAAVGVRADQKLRQMGDYLKSAQEFTFRADVVYDTVLEDGQKIQFGLALNVAVRRPDLLHAEIVGDEYHRVVVIDGAKATVYDAKANTYASIDVTGNLDEVLDYSYEKYGISVPVADLVYSDPYRTLIDQVVSGYLIGIHNVGDIRSQHLVFSQASIDWQVWIEDGARPVPRKLVITYKDEPGSPQYSATLSKWTFQPRTSDHFFEFEAPPGADEIEFLEDIQKEQRR
jgi:hypothetical protein